MNGAIFYLIELAKELENGNIEVHISHCFLCCNE